MTFRSRMYPWYSACALVTVLASFVATTTAQTEGTGFGCNPKTLTRCCWREPFDSQCPACGVAGRDVSRLYGCWGGFLRRGAGRLKYDWSYAGFMYGEQPLPDTMRQLADIKADFGAVGDGITDDTAAFEEAFKKVKGPGALIIPPGRYVITRALETWTNSFVLWGAGRDQTTLYFPKSLTEVYGNKYREGGACCSSDWSHSGAFIKFMSMDTTSGGGWDKTLLAYITEDAAAGSKQLQLSDTSGISVGDIVRIHVGGDKPGNDVVNYMLGNVDGCTMKEPHKMLGSYGVMRFFSRVTAVTDTGITLERHLPYDVYTRWAPELHKPKVRIMYNGVQDLTMEFPVTPFPGHLKELGYNAIFFRMTMHSYVRNVRILNADAGVYFWGTLHSTVDNVTIASTTRGARGPIAGHRGIWLEHGAENLVTRFRIADTYNHDISMSSFEQGTVVSEGSGVDLNIDFHRSAPYGNLVTNVFFGAATRPFVGSGAPMYGPHAGAYNTVWSVRASVPMKLPLPGAVRWASPDPLGPLFNFVDYKGAPLCADLPWQWYQETFNQRGLAPSNLHRALVRARLGQTRAVQVMAVPKPGYLPPDMLATANRTAPTPETVWAWQLPAPAVAAPPAPVGSDSSTPAGRAAAAAAAGAEDPKEMAGLHHFPSDPPAPSAAPPS